MREDNQVQTKNQICWEGKSMQQLFRCVIISSSYPQYNSMNLDITFMNQDITSMNRNITSMNIEHVRWCHLWDSGKAFITKEKLKTYLPTIFAKSTRVSHLLSFGSLFLFQKTFCWWTQWKWKLWQQTTTDYWWNWWCWWCCYKPIVSGKVGSTFTLQQHSKSSKSTAKRRHIDDKYVPVQLLKG